MEPFKSSWVSQKPQRIEQYADARRTTCNLMPNRPEANVILPPIESMAYLQSAESGRLLTMPSVKHFAHIGLSFDQACKGIKSSAQNVH
jgi:hypothetical protein